jgi:hypothetical protein
MKHFYLLLLAVFGHGFSFGQLDTMYTHLDTTQLTTNFFWDENLDHIFPPKPSDSIALHPSRVKSIIQNLDKFEVHANLDIIPVFPEFQSTNDLLRMQNNCIPITIVDVRYNYIDTNAVIDGRLFLFQDELYQMPNVSVFGESKTTIIYADIKNYEAGTYNFRLEASQFIHNYSAFPSSIRIDFGDGQGLRDIAFGQVVSINYSSNSEDLQLHVEITRDEEIHHGYMELRTNYCTSAFSSPTFPAPFPNDATAEFPWLISTTFEGVPICGNAYTLVTGDFDKPLIFVEGIDFNRGRSAERNGDFGWCQLTSGIDSPGYDYSMLARMPLLLNEAVAHGYDIVLLDFCDGATYLEHNGQLLVHLIQTINAHKIGNEPLVISGASMGGQVVRYALDYMEQNNIPHCARLYISLDSPHEGANIPLSIQQAIFLQSDDNANAQTFVHDYLTRPAAQQLLNYQFDPTLTLSGYLNPTPNVQWYDQMHSWGMPKMSRNIGIANGVSNGEGLAHDYLGAYSSSQPILAYSCEAMGTWSGPEGRIFLAHSGGDPYYNQEGFTSNSTSNVSVHIKSTDTRATLVRWENLFFLSSALFFPEVEHTVARVSSNTVNWDYAPGGYRTTAKDFVTSVNESGDLVSPCNQITEYLPKHCFIPTSSALGVPTNNPFLNVATYLSENQAAQIFDRIHAPIDSNEPHTYISESNLALIQEELFGGENADGSSLVPSEFNTGVFNYGKEGFNYLRSVHASNGARLAINGEYELHYGLDDSGYPSNSSHFQMTTLGHCAAANVLIDNEAILEMGSTNLNTSASLRLLPESSLTIGEYGNLQMHAGSSIIIENGASLIIYTNSNIEIQGSTIELRTGGRLIIRLGTDGETEALIKLLQSSSRLLLNGGELIIEQGVTCKISHMGIEGGYVQINSHQQHNIILADNATLAMYGNSKDDLMLQISNGFDFWTNPGSNGKIVFDHIYIDMNHHGTLWTGHQLFASNCKFSNPNNNIELEPALIHIINQSSCSLYNCDLEQVKLYTWRTNLNLHSSRIIGLPDGLLVKEGSFQINNTEFNETNLRSNSLAHLSTLSGCTFTNSTSEYFIEDESLVEIRISSCELANGINGILKSGGKLSLKCNSFGALSANGLEIRESSLNASSTNGAGYNSFEEVGSCIELIDATEIDLFKGYNDLSGYDANCIYGNLIGKHICENCQTYEDASYNHWGSANPNSNEIQSASGLYTPTMDEVNISVYYSNTNTNCNIVTPNGYSQGCEVIFTDVDPTFPTTCGNGKPVVRKQKHIIPQADPQMKLQAAAQFQLRDEEVEPGNPILNTPYFNEVRLDSALVFAASQMLIFDTLGNDQYACQLFHDILTSGLDRSNDDIRWKMNWGRYHMKGSLENLFILGVLNKDQNELSYQGCVQQYVDVLNTMTDTLLTDSTYIEQFYLELDKGQLLRTLGQSQEAKEAFAHLDDCQLDAPEQQALNNWLFEVDQEISLASQYLEEGLSPMEITLNIDTSLYETPTSYTSSNFYFGMWILGPGQYSFMNCGSELQFRSLEHENQRTTLRIYPNPTDSGIKLDVSKAGTYDVTIYNSVGQVVLRFENVSIPYTHEFPETWKLPAGVYQLTAVSPDGSETQRFVKQ